ncbi:MAG: STAS domain-containing protein [Pseudomonadales bacterium]|nr:STAS domain-containing protein [Pseudomonadales bacterium]
MKAFFTHQLDVTWDSAEAAKKHGYDLIDQFDSTAQHVDKISVDLSPLKQANSVIVAILSAWHRHASLQHKSIVFVNLSQELRNIIALSGLDKVIELQAE